MQKRFKQGTARIWEDCISGKCFWIQSRPNIWTYSPTDFLTRSPTHHATRRCSLHPDHLAHPRLSVFHRCATTTTTRQARTTTPVTPRATAARTVKKTTTPMTPLTNSFFLFIDVNSDHYSNIQQLLLISKSWSQSKLAFMLIPWHSHYYDGSWGPHTILDPLRIHVTINLSLAD